MPPILQNADSDDEVEHDSPIEIRTDVAMKNGEDDDDPDDGDDDDDEEAEDEYIVEKLESHEWDAATKQWLYKTKWVGWDNEKDRTWEPAENLAGAQESLDEYWEAIGGEPDPSGPAKVQKKRGRLSGAESNSKKVRISPVPGKSGRGRKSEVVDDPDNWGPTDDRDWEPPKATKDAWEDQLIAVETIEPDENNVYWAYLRWTVLDRNGKNRHTKHPLSSVYKAAPQTMLKFYEKHLVFADSRKSAG